MTMTDGEKAIVAQLKRIADALADSEGDKDFSEPVDRRRRFMEPWPASPYTPAPFLPWWQPGYVPTVTWGAGTTTTNPFVRPLSQGESLAEQKALFDEGDTTQYHGPVPTETNPRVWEHILNEGEGEHLLNPDADHTGDDVE